MRITLLKSQMNRRGGLEKYTLRLAGAFAKTGHKVTLLTTDWDHSNNPPDNVTCVNITKSHPLSFVHLLKFDNACKQFLARHPADVIFGMDRNSHQTHYRAGNGVHLSFLKRRKETESWLKSVSFSLNPLHRCLLHLEKLAFEDPELKILFTNSYLVRDEILQNYKTDPSKIQVVHNGVEWHEMQPAFDCWESLQSDIFRALKRKSSSFQLLFAGHNFHRKGLSFLLEGIKYLGRRDIQLSIVGKDKEQTLWLEKIYSMGLSDQVTIFGPQPTLKPFYQMADAIAVPSIYDPFANVTVEALAMGLFVITSKHNGAHEILNEENGVKIHDLSSPASVAEALSYTLDFRKTPLRAQKIREGVQNLDFSLQLEKIVSATLDAPSCIVA